MKAAMQEALVNEIGSQTLLFTEAHSLQILFEDPLPFLNGLASPFHRLS